MQSRRRDERRREEACMPVVRLSYPKGALTQDQKSRLAADLTEIVLDAEVDAVTEGGRMVTVVHFQEAAPEDWAVGGELRSNATSRPNHFLVDVVVLQGLLEGERRQATHRRIGEAFQGAFAGSEADPMLVLRVWVLIHEVREGSWGAAGGTVSALDVAGFINPDLDESRRREIAAAIGR
jgi:phenylpyruvate tautomerase PptA (4-oxalocrotonate tautomerase family)